MPPTQAVFWWTTQLVYGENLPAYRTLFSIIFTDFHLFDRLYGLKNVTADAVEQLLVES